MVTAGAARSIANELPKVEVRSRAEWRRWLQEHAAEKKPIWLVTHKRSGQPDAYLAYRDIVAEALCFGWIDSLPRKLDAQRSMRLLSPRKAGSSWSKVNKELAQELIATGLMTEAGMAVIERARRDGSWSRLDAIEKMLVPADLQNALEKTRYAAEYFDAFPRSTKRAILEWINSAKRPETRLKRIRETATLAAKNIRANQYRQPREK